MNSAEHTQETPKKTSFGNKLTLIVIVSLLIGPFFLVPLFVDPFSVDRKAHGTLVQPAVDVGHIELLINEEATPIATINDNWKLFYIMPNNCTKACEHSILQMERVRRSMDKLINKVTLLSIHQKPLSAAWQERAESEFQELTFTSIAAKDMLSIQPIINDVLYGAIDKAALDKGQSPPKRINGIETGSLYLLSPDGHIVAHYPPIEDEREAILYAKGIRKDLRKSIKGAR